MPRGSQRLADGAVRAVCSVTLVLAERPGAVFARQARRDRGEACGGHVCGREQRGRRREVGEAGHAGGIGVGGHVARAGVGGERGQESGARHGTEVALLAESSAVGNAVPVQRYVHGETIRWADDRWRQYGLDGANP